MNLNYIELINRFWSEVEMKDFLPSEACVYFRLLDVCNRLGWQNPFSLSNSRAVALTAMNEKTFRAVRDKLAERGLIGFRKGKRRESSPLYCFPVESENGLIFPWEKVLPVKNTVKNTANTPANAPANTTANTPANAPAYNKTKTKTYKSPDGDNAAAPTPGVLPFEKEELSSVKRKARKTKDPPFPPTLDEVMAYFISADANIRLENWEASARLFYDTFNADGWVNRRGRNIVERAKWESEANNWIFYREEREKNNRQNEQSSKNRQCTKPDDRQQRQSEIADYVARNLGRGKISSGSG